MTTRPDSSTHLQKDLETYDRMNEPDLPLGLWLGAATLIVVGAAFCLVLIMATLPQRSMVVNQLLVGGFLLMVVLGIVTCFVGLFGGAVIRMNASRKILALPPEREAALSKALRKRRSM